MAFGAKSPPQPHSFRLRADDPGLVEPNPICKKCGWRTYPLWTTTPHTCKLGKVTDPEMKEIRGWASNLLSILHFYRIHPREQVGILGIALAYALGRNSERTKALKRWDAIAPKIRTVVRKQKGGDTRHLARDVYHGTRPLKIRVRKPTMKIRKRRNRQ